MDTTDGFIPIVAMFYAVFHPTEGTKVVHQVPSGSIVPSPNDPSSMTSPLFDFDSIKNYVIPKPGLCNRLITFKIQNYRVVGFPGNIYATHYARNSFNFNFCFVFPYESDTTPYEGHVKRLGKMFRALEEQSQLLSKAEKGHEVFFRDGAVSINEFTPKLENQINKLHSSLQSNKQITTEDSKYLKIVEDLDDLGNQVMVTKHTPGQSKTIQPKLSSIESLVQQIFQDLNNYSECLIPIEGANSVDIKLFPIFPPPPEFSSSDVPIATVKLESMVDPLWDPTMLKILPFINGINSIKKISQLADADYDLTNQCIQHLLHYKSITILDIFQFSNSYAPTSQIGNFLRNPYMASECQAYVVSATGTFNTLPLRPSRVSMSNSEADGISINSSSLKLDRLSPINTTNPNNNNNNNNTHHHQQSFGVSPQHMGSSPSFPHNRLQRMSQTAVNGVNGIGGGNVDNSSNTRIKLPSKATLFYLYRSLNQNMTLKQWYLENHKLLEHLDIRRFVSFGVLRGLIYRVRSYPASTRIVNSLEFSDGGIGSAGANNFGGMHGKNYNISSLPITSTSNTRGIERGQFKFHLGGGDYNSEYNEDEDEDEDNDNDYNNKKNNNINDTDEIHEAEDTFVDLKALKSARLKRKEELKLAKLMKKSTDFDKICTEMNKSKREILSLLNGMGDWSIINS
ncbi:hypothetical protein CANARDRAFT_26037 [[Candida] arabinofermentans NRRL YB-2248]|uniref:Nitrogen permease regulator 2 n=1 Tax=[Candida] arabinofermentans NRRL YB-2248 TaxID=983967 RepID=A0A1E4T7W4_9ASCO|nr:hypothetical protein CANARDRAFT_26037 [[Candida] arabinofermentans NRRL YB-2248]